MDVRPCGKIGNCSCGMAQFLLWPRSKQPPWISTHPGQVIFLDSSKSPGDIRSSESHLDAWLTIATSNSDEKSGLKPTEHERYVSGRGCAVRDSRQGSAG